jgi:uncharacterized CHY-type Zn-finger protein
MKTWSYKKGGLSWRGQFSSILLYQWNRKYGRIRGVAFGCKWPYNREDYCSTVFHFVTALDQSKIVYNVKVWFPFKIQNINVHQIMVEWIIAYELLQRNRKILKCGHCCHQLQERQYLRLTCCRYKGMRKITFG